MYPCTQITHLPPIALITLEIKKIQSHPPCRLYSGTGWVAVGDVGVACLACCVFGVWWWCCVYQYTGRYIYLYTLTHMATPTSHPAMPRHPTAHSQHPRLHPPSPYRHSAPSQQQQQKHCPPPQTARHWRAGRHMPGQSRRGARGSGVQGGNGGEGGRWG